MGNIHTTTRLIDYAIILLYIITVFVPSFGAFDFAATQWLYMAILNFSVFGYYVYNYTSYLDFSLSKLIKVYFGIQLLVFIVSCLSVTQSLIVDESIIYLSRIFTFIFSLFNLFVIFRQVNAPSFYGVSIIIGFVVFIEAIEVVYYFTSKYKVLRTSELLLGMSHKYGNYNILATGIAIKVPFLLYLFSKIKSIYKYAVLFTILIVIISLLLIGARTAVFIMGVTLVSFSILYFVYVKYSLKKSITIIIPLLVVCMFAFGYAISINKIHGDKLNSYTDLFFPQNEKELYNPKNEINLVNGSGRNEIWNSALTDFKKSPIIGVGVGNWRHNSKKALLLKNKNKSILFQTHVHNDYLQILAETGVIGFVLYLGGYLLIIILLFKLYIKVKTDTYKLVVIILGLAFFTYIIDAFFNFPHHRAPIQVTFSFILAAILGLVGKYNDDKNNNKVKLEKPILYICLLFLIFNIVFHYKDYSASTVQLKLNTELKTKDAFSSKFKYSYDEVISMLPKHPYINQIGMTQDDIKALYAINEKKYNIALSHLNKSINNVENDVWPRILKAMIFNVTKKGDSAFYYSKEVTDIGPSIESTFNILKNIYRQKGDTIALFDLYNRHLKVRPGNSSAWINMCNDIRVYYKNDSLALKEINLALKGYPYDKSLLDYKSKLSKSIKAPKSKSDIIASKLPEASIEQMTLHFKKGNDFFNNKDYKSARIQFLKVLDIEPNNLPTHFKLGLLENLDGRFKEAIPYFTKVINDKYLNNGRPEYSRGVAYLRLKNEKKAIEDFRVSRDKKWPAALKLNAKIFN